jgi:hypothetical protein
VGKCGLNGNDTVLSGLAIAPFARLFSRVGKFEYTGCDGTEHRGQRLEQ